MISIAGLRVLMTLLLKCFMRPTVMFAHCALLLSADILVAASI